MTVLMAATTDPAGIHLGLPKYLAEQAELCPMLTASQDQGCTIWSSHQVSRPREVFTTIVRAAENVRRRRRTEGPLACAAVVLFGPRTNAVAQQMIAMPHWVAQHLYSRAGLMLMYRVVTPGTVPVSFVVVRPVVVDLDRAMMARPGHGWPDLSYLVSETPDDGADVFDSALGYTVADPGDAYVALLTRFPMVVPRRGEVS